MNDRFYVRGCFFENWCTKIDPRILAQNYKKIPAKVVHDDIRVGNDLALSTFEICDDCSKDKEVILNRIAAHLITDFPDVYKSGITLVLLKENQLRNIGITICDEKNDTAATKFVLSHHDILVPKYSALTKLSARILANLKKATMSKNYSVCDYPYLFDENRETIQALFHDCDIKKERQLVRLVQTGDDQTRQWVQGLVATKDGQQEKNNN